MDRNSAALPTSSSVPSSGRASWRAVPCSARVVEERAHRGGGEEAGADRVDVDPLRSEVDRELAGEVGHGTLRCAVGGFGGQPDQTADGGDVDDVAAGAVDRLLGEHLADSELAAQP